MLIGSALTWLAVWTVCGNVLKSKVTCAFGATLIVCGEKEFSRRSHHAHVHVAQHVTVQVIFADRIVVARAEELAFLKREHKRIRRTKDTRVLELRYRSDLRAVLDRVLVGTIGSRDSPAVSVNVKGVKLRGSHADYAQTASAFQDR